MTPATQDKTSTAVWLRKLRDQYSDEIPPMVVHSTDRNAAYKVRGAWWLLLDLVLERAATKRVFRPEFAKDVGRFAERVTRDDFSGRPRTAKDIAMGNQMIDEALRELEGENPASIGASPGERVS
jgi:hypothetical protein